MAEQSRPLGTWSGVGIVIANMIGAGVFLSAGFMAQDLGPGLILIAWSIGALLAIAGARAYAELATIVPRSGGEYRFLSDLLHPALGYLAGWASLLIGLSAPIAIDALAAGAFLQSVAPGIDARATAIAMVIVLTTCHAAGFRSSLLTQNSLIGVKLLLIGGFIVVGLSFGSVDWPTWTPPNATSGFPLAAFASSLFFIAFAFSGWNAAVYMAEEFKKPARQVPRALLIGCGSVAVLYLLLNYVLVANITPAQARVVFDYQTTRVTLGHVVASDLLGRAGGVTMSIIAAVAFVSAMSAMMMAGPRVYAAMGPRWICAGPFCGHAGRTTAGIRDSAGRCGIAHRPHAYVAERDSECGCCAPAVLGVDRVVAVCSAERAHAAAATATHSIGGRRRAWHERFGHVRVRACDLVASRRVGCSDDGHRARSVHDQRLQTQHRRRDYRCV